MTVDERTDDPELPRQYLGVMVSSTFRDLEAHRAALMRAIEGQGLHAVAMEQDAALPGGTVIDASLRKVRDAAAYVGIIGHLYGQIPESEQNPEQLSLTELEFREARALERPILLFIMGDEHPVKVAFVERDPARIPKLEAFREDVKRATADSLVHRVYRVFNDLNDFTAAATQSIAALRQHLEAVAGAGKSTSALTPDSDDRRGIPAPPQLYAEPPYIGSHAFIGRTAQLTSLDDWATAAEPHPVLLIEAIGGTGKSILAWEWITKTAAIARERWAGRFWYSFYERGAVMADFHRRALAYMTGQSLDDLCKKRKSELSELLLHQLQARPWLLVLDGLERILVAYHRYNAAQLADERAGRADEIAHRDPCAAIRPEDDDLLRLLAGITPSKILITSRLMPRVMLNTANQPIPGVLHERLSGLRPADAEALLRSCGVQGNSRTIQTYLQQHCDCHPLVIGIIAGLVNDYLPARGQFDAWTADPGHGNALDLAELDLVGKRNHILQTAITALSDPSRQLLSILALLPEAVDYDTLNALNPYLRNEADPARESHGSMSRGASEPIFKNPEAAARRILARTVLDLERRGLLQYDRYARRYDLHPVVRAVAAGGLNAADRDRLGQRVLDHFSSRATYPYANAVSLDDVRNDLTVIRTLLRMGRMTAACAALQGDLSDAMLYTMEAHAEFLSLVRPFFKHDWTSPTADLSDVEIVALSSHLAGSLRMLGAPNEALAVYERNLKIALDGQDWSDVRIALTNIANLLDSQNRFARSGRCFALALELAEAIGKPFDVFRARSGRFWWFAEAGQISDARRMWRLLNPLLDSQPIVWRAEITLNHAEFQFQRKILTEDNLVHAERLAHEARYRLAIRGAHALRGHWLLERGEWAGAADSLTEAVRMAREAAIVGHDESEAETQLALARLQLGQLLNARQEADRLAADRHPAHFTLAKLWQAIGGIDQAAGHGLAAYRDAWADGEPYVRRHRLKRAVSLLTALGVEIPTLSAYDPVADPKFLWEDELAAVIKEMRTSKRGR